MIKAKKICAKCRKIKELSCKCPKPKPFEGMQQNYSFYNSKKWRKYAHSIRAEEPLCIICLQEGRTTPSQMVDHIHPISKGGSKWERSNLQALCHKCHNKKTAKSKKA